MLTTKQYRNSKLFLRNEFKSDGIWGFPIIKKQELNLEHIDLISCSDVSDKDRYNLHKGVHFFVDDFRFESIYTNPNRTINKFKKYRFILTPDFSLYAEMKPWRQIESIGKSRWIGAYWQSKGLIVIPTISWGTPSSFRYCFDSIEHNAIVAVGMIGCKGNKVNFLRGYNAMLENIHPSAIICFGAPFSEMDGNVIEVNYLKSRRTIRDGR